ncbi:MAG: FAD-dependent monooxygenase [Propionibacteriaceae bacterium]|nr:FAD-dependent monooxygenase [Propionibacteriaceae bacterium]
MNTDQLKNLRVAIVGGGYGGASAAKALSNLGAQVTVYEQAKEIREVGAGIGLRPSSMDQFRQWGIFDAIADVTSASNYFEILTAEGHTIAKDQWPGMDDYETKTHTHLVHRNDFIQALVGSLPEGMVKTNKKLEKIVDNGGTATLTFADGETVEADLVVGADGIRSTVRAQLFSDQQPVFAGEHAYRVVVDADAAHGLVTDDNLRMYLGRGTKVYVLPLRHRNQMSFDVTALNTDPTRNPVRTKEDLLATVEGFDERIVKLVQDLDMDKVNIRAVYDIDPVDVWHSDSVVLLGDAAHAMCHHQGQGANSAILDAGALAQALKDNDTVKEAVAAYAAERKPITDELQRISRQGWSEDEVNDVFPGQKRPGEKVGVDE